MHKFSFAKMEGAGNDFIVIDNRKKTIPEFSKITLVRDFCRRAQGIGADGMLFIEQSESPECDFAWDFYNADGSKAEMCGNASRCVARFASLFNIVTGDKMTFQTLAGPIRAILTPNGACVQLPNAATPKFYRALGATSTGPMFDVYFLNTGVPHAVVPVQDVATVDVENWGKALRHHPIFGDAGANVNFMARGTGHSSIVIRTFERGVEGETLACGTGATASAIVAAGVYRMQPPITVTTRGGVVLYINFERAGENIREVFLEGPVRLVFVGEAFWPNESSATSFSELYTELH